MSLFCVQNKKTTHCCFNIPTFHITTFDKTAGNIECSSYIFYECVRFTIRV